MANTVWCRLLYASSKKETLVAGLDLLHTQALRLISKVPICSQKVVTPPPKTFVGQEGGVALLMDVFPMIEKLQRSVNNIER